MKQYYRVPNMIFEFRLSASAFVIYILLTNKFYFTGSVKIKLHTLSDQTGFCINTVRSALKELHNKGLLKVNPCFRNARRTTNEYIFNRLPGKFSRIDRRLFYYVLGNEDKSALLVYCAVNYYSNRYGRAYPSYSQISEITGLSRATCIRKINVLGEIGLLIREHYICTVGDYGHNNYAAVSLKLRIFLFNIILSVKAKQQAERLRKLLKLQCSADYSCIQGGIIFDKHIKNPLKYLKIENKKIIHTLTELSYILHENLKKIRLKIREGLRKIWNVF